MIGGRTARTHPSTPERIWQLISTTTDISWRPSISGASADGASSYRERKRRTGYTTEYTIANDQPCVRLTGGAAIGTFRHGDFGGKSILGNVTRSDLAAFLLDNLELPRCVNESVYIQS